MVALYRFRCSSNENINQLCSMINNDKFNYHQYICLTHWGRVTHICVSKLTIIGSDNGLSPGRRKAIIWTNAGILLIRTIGINFSEILSKIHTFAFKKMCLKMSSGKRRPFCLRLNVLTYEDTYEKHIWLECSLCIPQCLVMLLTVHPEARQ